MLVHDCFFYPLVFTFSLFASVSIDVVTDGESKLGPYPVRTRFAHLGTAPTSGTDSTQIFSWFIGIRPMTTPGNRLEVNI